MYYEPFQYFALTRQSITGISLFQRYLDEVNLTFDYFSFPFAIGTKEKLAKLSSVVFPSSSLVSRIIFCMPSLDSPNGITILPPVFNCAISLGGTTGAAAVIITLSNGA